MTKQPTSALPDRSMVNRVLVSSVIGTAIEWYDFFLYATAAALVFAHLFFPRFDPMVGTIAAFGTFMVGYIARPLGAVFFGHFGDRIGRKATLVATMLTMGLSTTLIGVLPGYAQAGVLAPWLLCLLRFGQGVGLGGEWGGAALLATENAPHGRRAWFGMFPQLGPPLGFILANGLFLLLLIGLGEKNFVAWAWRIPFLASAALVAIGLYVRVALVDTPAFRAMLARHERLEVPLIEVLRSHWRPLIQGSLAIVVCYALFYVSSVFALGYGVNALHIARTDFLAMLCLAAAFMALATPLSAALADRYGRRPVLLGASALAALVGFALPCLLSAGASGALVFLCLALGVMGLTFAPLGALLPELFPARVGYTGASSAYNLGGILGASLAPYLAQLLLERGGLAWVGGYIVAAAAISFLALLSMKETAHVHA